MEVSGGLMSSENKQVKYVRGELIKEVKNVKINMQKLGWVFCKKYVELFCCFTTTNPFLWLFFASV